MPSASASLRKRKGEKTHQGDQSEQRDVQAVLTRRDFCRRRYELQTGSTSKGRSLCDEVAERRGFAEAADRTCQSWR